MNAPASYKTVIKKYKACPKTIVDFYDGFEGLVTDYVYEVSVAFVFLKLEQAYNRSLYGGVRKLHRVNAQMAAAVMSKQHLTREGYLELFKNVFGQDLDSSVVEKIKFAEKVRDKIIHGKSVSDSDKRRCLSDVFDYSVEIENEVLQLASFSPFADMRGITGQAKGLDKTTSRWLMKGLGFAVG